MADAVTAQLRGHDYQGLLFWLEATLLLDPKSNVVRVTYEAKGPKAFDDVVVEYDPAVVMGGSDRVSATYISSKWKTTSADRFGHLDLAEPTFIGATSVSFLQRLKDAQEALAPTGAGIRFQLVTPARIADADDLRKLVSMYNRAFLVDSLLDGTGDHSWTGRIRHGWRRHLGLASDDELRPILSLLQIYDGHASTLELINRVNDRLRSVGLTTIDASRTDNRYDDLIHKLKGRGINTLDRASFRALCTDEGLFAMTHTAGAPPSVKRIAIRSFIDFGEVVEAQADSTLVLTNEFQQRYIAKDDGWRLAACNVVIDCTGNDGVLDAMRDHEWNGEKLFVSLSLGWRARRLYCFASRGTQFPRSDFRERFAPWAAREISERKVAGDDAPWEGIGCWHPVFPASGADVALMAAVAVKFVQRALTSDIGRVFSVYERAGEDGAFEGIKEVQSKVGEAGPRPSGQSLLVA
jgi:hypothetical protein